MCFPSFFKGRDQAAFMASEHQSCIWREAWKEVPSSYDGSQQFQPDFLPKAAFAAGLNASRTSTPSPKKGFHSMKPKDQTVKPGNSEDAQTGLDQFAAQPHLVIQGFLVPGHAGMVVPILAWPGGSPLPQEHLQLHFLTPAGPPRFLGNIAAPKGCAVLLGMRHRQPLAMNYSPECWSQLVTSGNCADTEQTAWDHTYSLFVTFTSSSTLLWHY